MQFYPKNCCDGDTALISKGIVAGLAKREMKPTAGLKQRLRNLSSCDQKTLEANSFERLSGATKTSNKKTGQP